MSNMSVIGIFKCVSHGLLFYLKVIYNVLVRGILIAIARGTKR